MLMRKDIYYKYLLNLYKIDLHCFLKSFREWEQGDLELVTLKHYLKLIEREQEKEEHYNYDKNWRKKLPEINSIDQNGEKITLKQFLGKKIVLYFYPKDMTPGCTVQSCNLRDNYQQLLDSGYVVLGCSADVSEKHQKFIEKYDLPFPLISDQSKEVLNKFGVWALKNLWVKNIWVYYVQHL